MIRTWLGSTGCPTFAEKDNLVLHIKQAPSFYRLYFVGHAFKTIDFEQKRAMTTLLNSMGLWSGQWDRFLFLDVPRNPPYKSPQMATD